MSRAWARADGLLILFVYLVYWGVGDGASQRFRGARLVSRIRMRDMNVKRMEYECFVLSC